MNDPRESLIRLVSHLLAVPTDEQEDVLHSVPVLVLVTDQEGDVTDWRLQTLAEATGIVATLKFAEEH